MKIKHKHTGQETGTHYDNWKNNIIPKFQEVNYDILIHPDIVDVFEINSNNGKLNFIESTDRFIAKDKYLKDPKYTIKDSDLSKFDEYYRLKNQSELSFFDRLKKIWNNIPKLKTIYERIINSTISKLTSIIITTVIGGILTLIIWAVYKTQLIELWNICF